MRGDGCIVLNGDMLDWPCGPGLCSIELTLPGPGLCDISGLGECSGLRPGCSIGLLSGDWTAIMDCCDDGDGDMSGDCGAMLWTLLWPDGEPTETVPTLADALAATAVSSLLVGAVCWGCCCCGC